MVEETEKRDLDHAAKEDRNYVKQQRDYIRAPVQLLIYDYKYKAACINVAAGNRPFSYEWERGVCGCTVMLWFVGGLTHTEGNDKIKIRRILWKHVLH